MKKLLLLVACALVSMASVAGESKTYTDQLSVTINGEGTQQQSSVTVELLDDNYINFALNNFVLKNGEDDMYVGNIEIQNLFLSNKGDYQSFSYNANLQIKPGNMEGVDEDSWVGPMLGNVPLILRGKIAQDKLYVTIDIDMMESLEQIIYVKFGSDFAEPSIVSSKEYKAVRTAYGMTNFGENLGDIMQFDTDAESSAIVETLSSNDVNLVIKGMPLSMGGQNMVLGDLSILNLETLVRNGYTSFADSCEVTFSGEGQFSGMTVPAIVNAKFSESQLYYDLKLIVDAMQMDLHFTYGTDFAPVSASGAAKQYSDNIVVTVNEESTRPIPATVEVEPLNNGGINFNLKNFVMELDGNEMFVGNIAVEDLKLYEGQGYQYFNYNGNLLIQKGDKEGVDEEDWIGPLLGEIPLRMVGRVNDNKLYVTIDIDMVSLDQIIHVTFGQPIEKVDAIHAVSTDETAKIFDLQGRRVANATKGIYIIGGRKVIK